MKTTISLAYSTLLLLGMLPASNPAFTQSSVSIEMMKERYRLYIKGDSVPIDSADEVANYIYHPQKEISNPRIDNSRARNIDLLNLRTKEYPEKKHFWSKVIEYKRYNGEKAARKKGHFWVWEYKYFYLDSISGIARNEIPQSIKDNYRKKNSLAYHAPVLSGTFHAFTDPLNMFGYVVTDLVAELPLDKGEFEHSKIFSSAFCHRSLLREKVKTFGLNSITALQHDMKHFGADVTERYKKEAKDTLPTEKKFDMLILQNKDLTSDIEVLSNGTDEDAELETLRNIIRTLPPKYFTKLWTLDNLPLPGFYVEAHLKNGEWTFSMDRFVKPY